MLQSWRDRLRGSEIWTYNLVILAVSTFLYRMGQGLLTGVSTNFYVNELGLSGSQVLWLTGIREIPGLFLMFIAALVMNRPLASRGAVSLILMGIGYGLHAVVNSYMALIVVALIASLGFHNWMPLESSMGLGLAPKGKSGRVLGSLQSIGALASIVGIGLITITASFISLRTFCAVGGVAMVLAGLFVARLPRNIGSTSKEKPRLLMKKRYWLYYVLIFFEGSRVQVFAAFGTLILVQNYGLDAKGISAILALSGIVNFLLVPKLGNLIDRYGESGMMTASYLALSLCFVGYAIVHNVWFLAGTLICINLLVTLSIGLSTYVHRIAPPEELTPTLSAGVSVNHITSVSMSLVAGTLLRVVGYEKLCWGAAVLILLSVPFAMAMKTVAPAIPQPEPASAE